MYAYDGTGLGHLARLVKISQGFSPNIDVLIVSGHEALNGHLWGDFNYIQLPNSYVEREKGFTNSELARKRVADLNLIIRDYKPHAFITDYLPLGKRCELYPIVAKGDYLKFFILRSDIGGYTLTHNDVFSQRNIYYLSEKYQRIFIGSDSSITPPFTYEWLPKSIIDKMQYVGLVVVPIDETKVEETRKKFLNNHYRKWIVCSAGGGKMASQLMRACLDLSQDNRFEDFQFDIILGPYSPLCLNEFSSVLNASNVRVHTSLPNLSLLNASADYVICSGAYNTLTESMMGRRKTIFSFSVQNDDEESEQSTNIASFSKFYDIRRIPSLNELKDYVWQNIHNSNALKSYPSLYINGGMNICREIEKTLEKSDYHA